jgi:hypothetical protein
VAAKVMQEISASPGAKEALSILRRQHTNRFRRPTAP